MKMSFAESKVTTIPCIFVPLNWYVDDVSGPNSQESQVQQCQQPESEQPSNPSDSQANGKHELPPSLSKPAAECSSDHPIDNRDDTGRTAGQSGVARQSFSEHEEGEEEANCDVYNEGLDTRGTGGGQTAYRAAGSGSGGEPGGETEHRAEGAESHDVEERRKTEPLVQQALIPTQTAAAQRGDVQQVVDLVDAEEGGEGRGKGALTSLPGDSRTIGGDTEQAQPSGSPADTQQREEADGSTSAEWLVDPQVSPQVGEVTSEEEHQLVEASAAPHQQRPDGLTAEGGAAQSDAGDTTEFSTSAERDEAASGRRWLPLSIERILWSGD